MHLDGDDIVTHGGLVGEEQDFRSAFHSRLTGRKRVIDKAGGHAQGAHQRPIEVVGRTVVHKVGGDQARIGKAAVPGEVGTVIDRNMAPRLVRSRDRRTEREWILGRRGLKTEQARSGRPTGVVERGLAPGDTKVGSPGVVVGPGMRDVDQADQGSRHIGH